MDKQITAVLIGAGPRGANTYITKARPGLLKIVGVAEPNPIRRNTIKEKYNLKDEYCFETYQELFFKDNFADLAIICTGDKMHVEPAEMAVKKGYHILLEKPISPYPEEVYRIGKIAENYDKTFSICHVLRYTPFFETIKKLLDAGKIGKLIHVVHNENVGFWHQAHSYVRGNWGNSSKASPMILAKSCHDMDILLYLIGSDCKKVSSFGELSFFKSENAPEGAAKRCLDGCPHFDTCQFNAVRLYTESQLKNWCKVPFNLDSPDDEKIIEALRTNPYGRCVFHCDNDVVDHQVVNMEFENGTTVAFTMCAFTKNNTRVMHFMGTDGEIEGDLEERIIRINDYKTGNSETIIIPEPASGHGGGDAGIINNVINLINGKGDDKTSAQISVQSHMMAFAAEKSRLENKIIDMKEFIKALIPQSL